MKLSIVIPAHNEEKFIRETIKKVFEIPLSIEKEVIVIDDGSTDNTHEILVDLHNTYNFVLKTHSANLGKGSALKTGFDVASGDLVVIQDADLEYDPSDILKLLEYCDETKMISVYGDRGAVKWPKFGYHYVVGAKFLTIMFNIFYGQKIKDLYTGYKLFRRNDIVQMDLQSSGFEFEAEVSCKFIKNGGKIIEIPIGYSPRNKDQGKHIGYVDAIKGIFTIMKV